MTPVRVDSWDVLDVGENGMETAYLCRVVNHGQDGIDFQFPEGARVYVDPGTSDTPVWFGAGRRPVDGPLDLTTLEPCETPE